MELTSIQTKLNSKSIFLSTDSILGKPTVIGYEKIFKWSWVATQLNTFIVVSDFGDELITKEIIEKHLAASFNYAKKNYKGWPRGLQSALAVVSIVISSTIDNESKDYCVKLKSGKKWAGFSIPVAVNSSTKEVYKFKSNPMWGRIYYPHFKKLINELV